MDPYGFGLYGDDSAAQLLESNDKLTNAAWAEFLRDSEAESATLDEILPFIWHHGCAKSIRGKVWMHLSGAAALRANGFGQDCSYTQCACNASESLPFHILHQIELDLPRTFSTHPDFRDSAIENEAIGVDLSNEASLRSSGLLATDASALQCLRRILRVIAAICVPVGYTQGMNFVSGFALLVMRGASGTGPGGAFTPQQEEDAFWFSLALFTRVLPGFYAEDMPTVRVACDSLQQQLQSVLPGVEAVMTASGLPVAALAPRWLLCLWLNACPSPVAAHIWDFMLLCHAAGVAQETQGAGWQQTPLAQVPLAEGQSCGALRCLMGTVIGMLRAQQSAILQCSEGGLDSTIAALSTLQSVGSDCMDALPALQYAFCGSCYVGAPQAESLWRHHRSSMLGAGSATLPLAAQVSWVPPQEATARLAKTPALKQVPPRAVTPEQRITSTPPYSPLRSPGLKLPSMQRAAHQNNATPLAKAAMMAREAGSLRSPVAVSCSAGVTPPVVLPPLLPSPASRRGGGSVANTPQSPAMALFGTPLSSQAPYEQVQTASNRTPLHSPAARSRRPGRTTDMQPVQMPATPLACAHTPGHQHPLASPTAALEGMLHSLTLDLELQHDVALRLAGPFGFGALCPTQLKPPHCNADGPADVFRLHPAPTSSPGAAVPAHLLSPAEESTPACHREFAGRVPGGAAAAAHSEPIADDDRSFLAVASALAHVAGSPAQQREAAHQAALQAQQARRRPLQAINKLFSPKTQPGEAKSRATRSSTADGILLSPVRKPSRR